MSGYTACLCALFTFFFLLFSLGILFGLIALHRITSFSACKILFLDNVPLYAHVITSAHQKEAAVLGKLFRGWKSSALLVSWRIVISSRSTKQQFTSESRSLNVIFPFTLEQKSEISRSYRRVFHTSCKQCVFTNQ